jgi:Transcription initiation factor TFIID component TAF4 family
MSQAEEEGLQRNHDQHDTYRSYEDRTRRQPANPSFDSRILGTTIRTIGTQHKVPKVPEDSVNYVALAVKARLQQLIKAMIDASAHRTDTQFDRPASFYEDGNPMWSIVVRRDVAKQLATMERIERDEEMKIRRERKERAEIAAAQAATYAAQSGASNDDGYEDDEMMQPRKKKKKDGPGVTARNMSEDVRKKMSNAVASQAAGLGARKYAWMSTGTASVPSPKPKPTSVSSPVVGVTPQAQTQATTTSSWVRPYVPTTSKTDVTSQKVEDDTRRKITLRDAMFVIEKERGHGGGRGAAKGYPAQE